MYNIYQLTKDFQLSKGWCNSQGSSSVIHVKQSSTVASFSPRKYLLHTHLQPGASTKGPLVSAVPTDSPQPTPNIIHSDIQRTVHQDIYSYNKSRDALFPKFIFYFDKELDQNKYEK
jgi:hypothetical protein